MRIRNPFLYPIIALVITGAGAAAAGAQEPATGANTAVDAVPAADTVPVTTSSADARLDYEHALLYH